MVKGLKISRYDPTPFLLCLRLPRPTGEGLCPVQYPAIQPVVFACRLNEPTTPFQFHSTQVFASTTIVRITRPFRMNERCSRVCTTLQTKLSNKN